MALTTTSSITPLLERIHQIEMAANSDTVGMSHGGFATVADGAEGYSRTAFYAAAGTPVTSIVGYLDGRIAQLSNGDVVTVGTGSGGAYVLGSPGATFDSDAINPSAQASNADVAAALHCNRFRVAACTL